MNTQDFSTVAQRIEAAHLWLLQYAPGARLVADTRSLQAGDVFFAFPVLHGGDGRAHLAEAVARGARAVLFDDADYAWPHALSVPHLAVSDLAHCAGRIAKMHDGCPDQSMRVTAVTGTNGKTSCSQWLARARSRLGQKSGVIGTLGVGIFEHGTTHGFLETGLTTPDALSLHNHLLALVSAGVRTLAIEASSIGLVQGRMAGLHVDQAVLTNLTRDHLDFHGTMQAYLEAKHALFLREELRSTVINVDDPHGAAWHASLTAQTDCIHIACTLSEQTPKGPMLRASQMKSSHLGTTFHLDSSWGSGLVKTQMIGGFNVSNMLEVMACLLDDGVPFAQVCAAVETLAAVDGRMQLLGNPGHVMLVIDYAHTPDALEKTLSALRAVAEERNGALWCVFGCGGDRDPGKRPEMGRIAQRYADHVVVTSDNPRTEPPAAIMRDILAGTHGQIEAIEDRAKAILYAVRHAGDQDVILLAGKGHEAYQDIQGRKWPFSDAEHAALALTTVATRGMKKKEGPCKEH